jgi:hypothetical protein
VLEGPHDLSSVTAAAIVVAIASQTASRLLAWIQFIVVLGATSNRTAASRQLKPSISTARITRSRKSIEYGRPMQAGLKIQPDS